jgi:hypothetical protein
MTKMWRLNDNQSGGFIVINPDAIDQMRPSDTYVGTQIILRSGRVVEVAERLGTLLSHVELEVRR